MIHDHTADGTQSPTWTRSTRRKKPADISGQSPSVRRLNYVRTNSRATAQAAALRGTMRNGQSQQEAQAMLIHSLTFLHPGTMPAGAPVAHR